MLRWLRTWWQRREARSTPRAQFDDIELLRQQMLPLNRFFPILVNGPDGPIVLTLSWHGLRAGRAAAVVTVDLDRETALALKRVIELHFETPRRPWLNSP